MRRLNVLNLALTDEGGAGIAARGLNDLLTAYGHNSVLVVKESELVNDNVVVLTRNSQQPPRRSLAAKVRNRFNSLFREPAEPEFDERYCFYDRGEAIAPISVASILAATPFRPDAIILHWVSGFVNPPMIAELAERTKATMLWLMMDNAPITGGCHYPWECVGYQSDCSRCPAILAASGQSLARDNLLSKQRHLPKEMGVLACSEGDFRRALSSAVFAERAVSKFLIPVDAERYSPGDKNEARARFGIGPDTRVIFYGSILLSDKRKGGQLFIEALRQLRRTYGQVDGQGRPIVVLVAGRANLGVFEGVDLPVKIAGYLDEEALISAYRSADVFVSSSLEDSGPLMINQSVMCGTPVVAFEVGVALDLVHSGRTGYRARIGDVDDLAAGIAGVLGMHDEAFGAMRALCRSIGLEMCDPHQQMLKLTQILERPKAV